MRAAVVIVVLVALATLGASALAFDATTILFIGAAMLVVTFFAGAAVVLGAWTRRAERRDSSGDEAETIADPHRD